MHVQGRGRTHTSSSSIDTHSQQSQYHPYSVIDWSNATSEGHCWLGDTTAPLPDINTEDSTVAFDFQDWIHSLVAEFAIDGLRIDGRFSHSPSPLHSLTPCSRQVSILAYCPSPYSQTVDTSIWISGRLSAPQEAYFALVRFSIPMSSTASITSSIVPDVSPVTLLHIKVPMPLIQS